MLRELHRGGRFSEVKRAASPVTRETMEASGRQSRSVLGGPITDVFIGQSGVGVYTSGYDERDGLDGSREPLMSKRELGSSGLRGPRPWWSAALVTRQTERGVKGEQARC